MKILRIFLYLEKLLQSYCDFFSGVYDGWYYIIFLLFPHFHFHPVSYAIGKYFRFFPSLFSCDIYRNWNRYV